MRLVTLNNATPARGRGPSAGRARTPAGPRRTPRPWPTSASSTPARARSRSRSSTRAGIPQISPVEHLQRADDAAERPGRAGQVLPDRCAHVLPDPPQRQRAGRRARHRDARPRLQGRSRSCTTARCTARASNADAVATAARFGLAGRRQPRGSAAAPASAIRRAKARTAWPTPASPPTAPCGCSASGAPAQGMQLFGTDGVAETASSRPPAAFGRPPHVRHRRRRSRRRDQFGNRDPYFVYGYEAMKLILDGSPRRRHPTKAAARLAARPCQNRQSVLGTYGFDANGDTTLRTLRRSTASSARASLVCDASDHGRAEQHAARRASSYPTSHVEPSAARELASPSPRSRDARRTRRRRG